MITVVVAADTQLLRQLLCEALDGRGGPSVLATAPNQSRGLALVEGLEPDVAIVSMGRPEAEALVHAGGAGRLVPVL